MARSMTGFGRSQIDSQNQRCVVEIRTVNSRYLDLNIKIPRALYGIENKIRALLSQTIKRGKVDVYINYDDFRAESVNLRCNTALVKEYKNALNNISEIIGSDENIKASTIAKFNDVLNLSSGEPDDEESWNYILPVVQDAVDSLTKMRETEGKALVKNIKEHIKNLHATYKLVIKRAPEVSIAFSERLQKRITELAGDVTQKLIDEERLSIEVAIFADKCSIDEELTRLDSHIEQLKKTLSEKLSIGKKIDFIVQELNREINTIGSKANDALITTYVVEMKNIVENIREQIQNLE